MEMNKGTVEFSRGGKIPKPWFHGGVITESPEKRKEAVTVAERRGSPCMEGDNISESSSQHGSADGD